MEYIFLFYKNNSLS